MCLKCALDEVRIMHPGSAKGSFKGVKKESDGTGWLCPKKLPSEVENFESISFKVPGGTMNSLVP